MEKYDDLQFKANKKCISKAEEIEKLEQQVKDAAYEIKVLEELMFR